MWLAIEGELSSTHLWDDHESWTLLVPSMKHNELYFTFKEGILQAVRPFLISIGVLSLPCSIRLVLYRLADRIS